MSKRRIVPYLIVEGGLDAIRFYEEVFGAEAVAVMMADDGKRVLHAELALNDGALMLSDSFPEMGASGTSAPGTAGAASVCIHLDFKKPKQVDQTMQWAADAGAAVIMPAHDAFWGSRYGRLRDPFGHVWALNAPLKKKDLERHGYNAANSPRE